MGGNKTRLNARSRHGAARQKEGSQTLAKAAARQAAEADGTSLYAPLGTRPEHIEPAAVLAQPLDPEAEAARKEKNRMHEQAQGEKDNKPAESRAAEVERVADVEIALGTRGDDILPESVARQHQRAAAKMRAVAIECAKQYGPPSSTGRSARGVRSRRRSRTRM